MIAAADGSRRLARRYGKSVMRASPFAAAMVAAFCVAGMAMAEPPLKHADIAGRWVSDRMRVSATEKLTLDISRCADGWCGVEVRNGSCGRTTLRLDEGELREPVAAFNGRIGLASGAQPYGIRVHLSRYEGAFQLDLFGNSGDEFEPLRRNYPYRQLMARTGEAVCPPDPKVS
ncbi:MAG: hypothetical protein ABWY47_03770 [Xanthobacteraceae bacterium]